LSGGEDPWESEFVEYNTLLWCWTPLKDAHPRQWSGRDRKSTCDSSTCVLWWLGRYRDRVILYSFLQLQVFLTVSVVLGSPTGGTLQMGSGTKRARVSPKFQTPPHVPSIPLSQWHRRTLVFLFRPTRHPGQGRDYMIEREYRDMSTGIERECRDMSWLRGNTVICRLRGNTVICETGRQVNWERLTWGEVLNLVGMWWSTNLGVFCVSPPWRFVDLGQKYKIDG
jgi:hypothetical protein